LIFHDPAKIKGRLVVRPCEEASAPGLANTGREHQRWTNESGPDAVQEAVAITYRLSRSYAGGGESNKPWFPCLIAATFGEERKKNKDGSDGPRTGSESNIVQLFANVVDHDKVPRTSVQKLRDIGVIPTFSVTSGSVGTDGALRQHDWLVWESPLETKDDLARAKKLMARLISYCGSGDNTAATLAHPYRPAGTLNRKSGRAVPVRFSSSDGRKWTLNELQAILDRHAPVLGATQRGKGYAPSAVSKDEGGDYEAMLPGITTFMRLGQQHFNAAQFVLAYAEAAREVEIGKSEAVCPLWDIHSDKSRGLKLFAYDAADSRHGKSYLGCNHAHENDDKTPKALLCHIASQAELTVDDLLEFIDDNVVAGEIRFALKVEALSIAPRTLTARIAALTKASPLEDVLEILGALAVKPRSLATDDQLVQISKSTERGKKTINDEYKRLRAKFERPSSADDRDGGEDGIDEDGRGLDPATYDGPIRKGWGIDVSLPTVKSQLNRRNDANPFLFMRDEGGCVQFVETGPNLRLVEVATQAAWSTILTDHVSWTNDHDVAAFAPSDFSKHFSGMETFDFPIIKGILRIPTLGRNDEIRWERGFDASLGMYVAPNFDPRPLPSVVTAAHLEEAIGWLIEATRDFPFSDEFAGADAKPIKLDELDADGWKKPNLKRGESSRAHWLAMALQPFVRGVIDGPCPAFHIDKPKAGTGAGYLVNVAHYIAEGSTAVPLTMGNNEEFKKTLTSTLRGGAGMLFVDNVNRKVDSGDFASLMTTNIWRDRILGKSETVDIKVDATILFAGNNISFSGENLRRVIPIRMDAAVPNPARDRKGPKAFKHKPLVDWLRDHRVDLVWACLILVKNWVECGKPLGTREHASFDHWSQVIGGILDAAGVQGFLENTQSYVEHYDGDADDTNEVAVFFFEQFKCYEWTTEEAVHCFSPVTSIGLATFGIDEARVKSSRDQARKLGEALKPYVGQTFKIDDPSGTGTILVTLNKAKIGGLMKYWFSKDAG